MVDGQTDRQTGQDEQGKGGREVDTCPGGAVMSTMQVQKNQLSMYI